MTIFNFDEYARKFAKRGENTVGKGEIACYKQFLHFPLFYKDLCCQTPYLHTIIQSNVALGICSNIQRKSHPVILRQGKQEIGLPYL